MAGHKLNPISLPEDYKSLQIGMFTDSANFLKRFPPIQRDIESFRRILYDTKDYLGLDFEFPPSYVASIIGISNRNECAAVNATPELVTEVIGVSRDRRLKLVGHSVIGAEMECVKKTTGIQQSVDEYDDSMLKHYLLNADLAKAPDKGEEDDKGALGFMNLWTAVSMVMTVPRWKDHRGPDCEGVVCPQEDSKGYCAVDAWASLEANYRQDEQLTKWNIPDKLYHELRELSWIAQLMQNQGVKIDMKFVEEFNTRSDDYKEKLFDGKNLFNPRASGQVQAWFAAHGISLTDTSKKTIVKQLEKTAERYGFTTRKDDKFDLSTIAESEDLPETLDALYRLYEYKSSGKGLDPWFAEKYRDAKDFIHPRFITIGASTGRWSSARPNFTNIPTRGFGALVGAAIIPRDECLDFVAADSSNLELRTVLYLAGIDTTELFKERDPFLWLVSESGGKFNKAAEMMSASPRQAAKSVAHASSYLEGIKIIPTRELGTSNIKKQEAAGALRIYRDWEYCGGVVAFTGANLSERLFGDKSYTNRRKALEISEDIYFKTLPWLRAWHRSVLKFIEENGYVRYPTGHFIRLYGSPEENAKMGTAALGQGVGAHHMQGLILRFYREHKAVPVLFIHDSLKFEIPRTWEDRKARDFIALMGEETDRFPGFKAPYKAHRGRMALEYDLTKPETNLPGAMVPLH